MAEAAGDGVEGFERGNGDDGGVSEENEGDEDEEVLRDREGELDMNFGKR